MPSDRTGASIAVFDLGGTWFRWGSYSLSQGLGQCSRVPALNYLSHPDASATELQEAMLEFILTRVSSGVKTAAVSVGAPVNVHTGTVLGSGPLWGPSGGPFPLLERLQRAAPQLKWHLVNDITALLAPYMRADEPYSKTLLVTVSSGIGSRVYDHRARRIPYDGRLGVQGEIGHLACSFEIDGKRINRHCECGGWNHINAFSSGRGIAATLKELPLLLQECSELLPESVAEWQKADDDYRLKALLAGLEAGTKLATDLLDCFVTPLTRALATALTVDPEIERIVMTGGVVHGLGEHYRVSLQRTFLREGLYQITVYDPDYLRRRVHWEEPDDFSGLRGAGVYAASLHREEPNCVSN